MIMLKLGGFGQFEKLSIFKKRKKQKILLLLM